MLMRIVRKKTAGLPDPLGRWAAESMSHAQEVRRPIDFRFSSLASATMLPSDSRSPLRQSRVKFLARGADTWPVHFANAIVCCAYPLVVFDPAMGRDCA